MAKIKHIHKYERKIIGKEYKVMRCAFGDCTHYLSIDLAEGKQSVCWSCGEVLLLDKIALMLKRPKCENCRKGRTRITEVKTDRIDRLHQLMNAKDKTKVIQ